MKLSNIVFCLFLMIGSVSAISSNEGIWGGYDQQFVYAQYCNGTIPWGNGYAHIKIYENKTGATSCNSGYYGTRLSFVGDFVTPFDNNLMYGIYNYCGGSVLNYLRYSSVVYFYADNLTNKTLFYPYGVYGMPQFGNNQINCITNHSCTWRADSTSVCYQNTYNASFSNGTYNPRLYFRTSINGGYTINESFLHTGWREDINNTVYGQPAIYGQEMFNFGDTSTTTTTTTTIMSTTTITTSSTIPMYYIDVSVNQTLGLDMSNNVVGLFHCATEEQYAHLFANPDDIPDGCSNIFGNQHTNSYGNISFFVPGGISYNVISVFPGTSYIDGIIIPYLYSNVSILMDYSGFVSSLYGVDFFERNNANVVVNVSYSIHSTSGNISLMGRGSSVRWNSSNLNGYYTISANAPGYQPLTDGSNLFVLRNLWQGVIDNEYLIKSTIENNNYTGYGKIINGSSSVFNNIRVDLSCSLSGGNVVYTNSSGYWVYNKFSLHDVCSVSSDANGLCERRTKNFEITFNDYFVPIMILDSCGDSVIQKDILNFIVWKEIPSLTGGLSTWDYLSNVKVVVNCDNGISKTSEPTDNYGRANVKVDDGSVCRYSVSGVNGYIDASGSINNNPQEIKLGSTKARSCYVFGLCKYDNLGRLCAISLVREGKNYYNGLSDGNGNYNIPVQCGFDYLVSAVYLNCTGYSSMISVSQGESGSYAANVDIPVCNMLNPTENTDFDSFLSSLIPIGEMIILGFFLYVLVSVWGRG